MKVNLVVIVFQGVIDDVQAFREENDAKGFFKQETGVSWETYEAWTGDKEIILGNYAGSNIWEIAVK